MDVAYKGTVDRKPLEDEVKRLKDENDYMKSTLYILHKNIIVRDEKPELEIKPPDVLKGDQELIHLTTSVSKVSYKFYSLEMELDHVYSKLSELSFMISGIEGYKKKVDVAKARKPRDNHPLLTNQSQQCLKLEKDMELITSAWRGMKVKESEIKDLKENIHGKGTILAALDTYVICEGKNATFDIPSIIQSDPRFVMEMRQAKRIVHKFENITW